MSDNDIDILALSETWLDEDHHIRLPHGRQIIRQDLTNHSGGVAIILRSHGQTHVVQELCYQTKTLEVLTIMVSAKLRLLISVVHRHSKASITNMDTLSELLSTMTTTGHRLFLLGDLNCDVLKAAQGVETTRLLSTLYQLHLSQLIQNPTRTTPISSTCADLVTTNARRYVSSCGVINHGASDHDDIFFIIKIRYMKKMSSEDLIIGLSIPDWYGVLNTDDASVAAEHFSEIMQRMINFHAPQREVQLNSVDSSPWLSNEICGRLRRHDLWNIRAQRTKHDLHWDLYCGLRNSIRNDIRNANKSYNGDRFSLTVSGREKWKVLDELLESKTRQINNLGPSANKLNTFFANTCTAHPDMTNASDLLPNTLLDRLERQVRA